MEMIIILVAVIAISAMWVIKERQSQLKAKDLLKSEQERALEIEKKLDSARLEMKKAKDELERGKSALREARELAKKKLKRQIADEPTSEGSEITMTTKALEDSMKAISAMEMQMDQIKDEQQKELSSQIEKLNELKDDEISTLKKRLEESQEEIKRQKRLMRPEGQKIDLKTLPDEAAAEFARVSRKAQQHEKLHGIANAKLHLAQEKFAELQKRYFSVCRELAILSGQKENIEEPKEASDVAEGKEAV